MHFPLSHRFLAGLILAGLPALPALAQQTRCTVTEVAPGVKMRSAPCSNPFGSPFAPTRVEKRPEAVPADQRGSTFRFGSTELRVGGRARYEMQGGSQR